jgi:uncharacterized protein
MKSYITFLFFITLLSCYTNKNQINIDDAYVAEIEKNTTERSQNRINYLQLTGLFKLNAETNTFGRDSINDFVLNIEELSSQIGEISVFKDSLVFTAAENVKIKNNQDSIITSYHLKLDENGSSIKLFHKQLNWQVITRSKQYYLRVWDTKNPALEAFKGFEQFKLNPEFIFEGQFTYYKESKSEIVKSKVDGQRKTSFIGKITFEYNSETHDLDVGNAGFTMVSDETTGDETYGGGRYVDLNLPETDGLVMLDFNYLYNPPCAFSKFTTCLYPPRQNVLPFKIEAGEKIILTNN